MIVELEYINKSNGAEFGGKASSLGQMIMNNINIPKGFGISSVVFTKYLNNNGILYSQKDLLLFNREIQKQICEGKFPDDIEDRIRECFDKLSEGNLSGKYIVRSSALCEDSNTFSMAGMFSSFIDLTSFDDVLNAIKKCYASMYSEKVLEFVFNNNINQDKMKMGIAIQQFIVGDISGVNFSVDTINMDKDHMHINAIFGICNEYVSGMAQSSYYRINKHTNEIIENYYNSSTPQLANDLINLQCETTKRIEEIFGCPQDIEWTISRGKLYILQSRPITTYKNNNFSLTWDNKCDSECTWELYYNQVMTPLDIYLVKLESNLKNIDTNCIIEILVQNGFIYKHINEIAEINRIKMYRSYYKLLINRKLFLTDVYLPNIQKLIKSLDKYINRELKFEEICNFFDLALEYFSYICNTFRQAYTGRLYIDEFKVVLDKMGIDLNDNDYFDLIYGESILCKERELIYKMVSEIKSSNSLLKMFNECAYDKILYYRITISEDGGRLLELINNYIGIFGMCHFEPLNVKPVVYSNPVISERPEYIIAKIRSVLYVELSINSGSINGITINKDKLKETILLNLSKEDKDIFINGLALAEKSYLEIDAYRYYYESMPSGYLKLAISQVGKYLVKKSKINYLEDVFYLTIPEIKDLLLGKFKCSKIINNRKKLLQAKKTFIAPTFIGKRNDIRKNDNYRTDLSNSIKGIPGIKKNVIGKVHFGIPKYIEESHIIVFTDDFYTLGIDILQLVDKVKGFVFETGSPFSHNGILLRELEVPCMYGVKGVSEILSNNDIIELNGCTGEITLIKKYSLRPVSDGTNTVM